ncbi:MAG: ABC transporter ATP-binding protein [Deltaproteobacteria bacterium]|nr:ABC transporter ATP-binding protein [Deltaproteobacteria bacterium]
MAEVGDVILSVCDLRTHFRGEEGIVKAVDGVSFDLRRGGVLGIVGESGSGKSVTNLSILRLIPDPPGRIVGGEILFHRQNLLSVTDAEMRKVRGNRISMIFQDPMTSLNPYLTVGRQLTEVLEEHFAASPADARRQSIDMLARVGIPEPENRIDQYPHQFSGGMRQRVMIAMALLCKPEILIADEPTTAVDVTIQAQILDLIGSLRRDLGTAVILVTHDLGVVAGMADEILVMYAGRVVERGTADDIFHRPSHPYTLGLLRSIPRLDTSESRLVPIRGTPPDLARLDAGCPFRPRCDFAEARCSESYPPTRTVGAATHEAACFVDPATAPTTTPRAEVEP